MSKALYYGREVIELVNQAQANIIDKLLADTNQQKLSTLDKLFGSQMLKAEIGHLVLNKDEEVEQSNV